MFILFQLQDEQKKLNSLLIQLQSIIKNLPDGNLLCTRCGTQTKWYLSNGSNPTYLPKKNIQLAKDLALKKYYLAQISETTQTLKLINKFINRLEKIPHKSDELIAYDSPYHNLIMPYLSLNSWSNEEYVKNPNHKENLIHKCLAGHLVRSKSEEIIANTLFSNHIPYRYECELILDSITLYPDFTILHPSNNEIFYWEHFGLINNSNYRNNAFNKLKIYGDYNIIPSINLITTYEDVNHPLDSDKVQKIVDNYFCY